MNQKEFEQLKAQLEKIFAENEIYRNVWSLIGYLTACADMEGMEERIYTESQLKELFDMVMY